MDSSTFNFATDDVHAFPSAHAVGVLNDHGANASEDGAHDDAQVLSTSSPTWMLKPSLYEIQNKHSCKAVFF